MYASVLLLLCFQLKLLNYLTFRQLFEEGSGRCGSGHLPIVAGSGRWFYGGTQEKTFLFQSKRSN